ncbi:MAG: hypothetical protein BWY22_00166 [Bacteroidetes bacterium ADurb.Bin217]|nr:MAG: hypothetical protein BWY22_00166 [Bacteroidetes bacterium ADurb.Bin217]
MKTTKSLFLKVLLFLFVLFLVSCDELIGPSSTSLDGVWKCSEVHEEEGTLSYDVTIDTDERDSTVIYIYNFMNLESNPNVPVYARATVSGTSIQIPQQTISGHTVEGSGYIQSNNTKITLDFTDDLYGGTPWEVNSTYTKYQ